MNRVTRLRIVIDFQDVSEAWRDGPNERRKMRLLRDIAKSGDGHDIIVALNDSDKQLIRDVRDLLFDILPKNAFCTWSVPGPVSWSNDDNMERRKRAELIREAFLSSLEPDVVLVSGFYGGYANDSVTSVSELASLPTAVILHDTEFGSPPDPSDNQHLYQEFLNKKQSDLEKADRVFLVGKNSNPESIVPLSQTAPPFTPLTFEEKSSEQVARDLIKNCETLARENSYAGRASDFHRKRLAYVSPLPPEMSGIAEYSAQLIPELAQHYDMAVIVDQETVTFSEVNSSVEVQNLDWFHLNSDHFDHVLYHFGNSPAHKHMYDLLRQVPGIVVLHDFFLLDGLQAGHSPTEFKKAILSEYGLQEIVATSLSGSDGSKRARPPGNLAVLQSATGIIVHNDHALQLARDWYGPEAAKSWHKIPLLRPSADYTPADKIAARKKLGFAEDDLVICSFGHIVPSKLYFSLLEALQNSTLANDPRCKLVLVGGAQEDHENELHIAAEGLEGANFKITGWVSTDVYRDYLLAADLAVQLRSGDRGETSASVLDCLNFGIPTIVNAHGSMRELNPESVYCITDPVEQTELVEALNEFASNVSFRDSIGARGRRTIQEHHDPKVCAELYRNAIESAESPNRKLVSHLPEILARSGLTRSDVFPLARSLAQNFPPEPRRPSLFLDVSAVSEQDIHTGIQRVVRSVLQALLLKPDIPYRVVPVRFTNDGEYLAAYNYGYKLMDLPLDEIQDEIVDVYRDDLLVVLDLDFRYNSLRRRAFEAFQNRGARIWHVVYDLLPVRLPHYFPSGTQENFTDWLSLVGSFDGAICISKAVADDLKGWLAEHSTDSRRLPDIGWFHLGADIENSRPTKGLLPDADQRLSRMMKRPTFLMVGTIEPRKGHAQTLSAFEMLWRDGIEINLAIVGKKGWDVSSLVRRLRKHPEGQTRLFWFENISDEYLERIYQASTCLIAASEGEGFGLPLIEAAQHTLPILARDLPVFREVAGEHAVYFSGLEAQDLANAVRGWLEKQQNGQVVPSSQMPWLTWKESAAQLLDVVTRK